MRISRQLFKPLVAIPDQGMAMKCSGCGAELLEGATFCGSCGKELITSVTRRCAACGRPIPSEALECQYCGFEYRSQTQATMPPSVGIPARTPGTGRNLELYIAILLAVLLVLGNLGWLYHDVQEGQRYDSLQGDYSALKDGYEDLYDYLRTYETFQLESTIADFYETVREANGMTPDNPWTTENVQQKLDFCAELSMHDYGQPLWPTQESLYYNYYKTHSYSDAKARMAYFLTIGGVETGDSSVEKIGKILVNVRDYVHYEMDFIERVWAPWETLAHRSGDCDDYSILVAALFELAGVDSAIGLFTNDENEGHAMVLVHLENLGPYEFYHYDDLAYLGLSSGQWIVLEPQDTLEYQADESWMGQWDILAAAET